MSGVATAIVGGNIVSGILGADAASSAADAQRQAAADATAEQRRQYDQTRQDQAPYRNIGDASLNRLAELLGFGTHPTATMPTRDGLRQQLLGQYTSNAPNSGQQLYVGPGGTLITEAQMLREIGGDGNSPADYTAYSGALGSTVDEVGLNAAIDKAMQQAQQSAQIDPNTPGFGSLLKNFGASDFQTDPGYQFRLSEGLKGINNSAAARTGVLSGAALKAANQYNQNFASNEYSNAYNRYNTNQTNQYNRLASLAGVGQTATNQVAAAGQNMANNVSENIIGAGNSRASGYIGGANAIGGGISGAINGFQGNRLMSLMQDRANNNFWGNMSYSDAQNLGGYYPYGGAGLDVGNIS